MLADLAIAWLDQEVMLLLHAPFTMQPVAIKHVQHIRTGRASTVYFPPSDWTASGPAMESSQIVSPKTLSVPKVDGSLSGATNTGVGVSQDHGIADGSQAVLEEADIGTERGTDSRTDEWVPSNGISRVGDADHAGGGDAKSHFRAEPDFWEVPKSGSSASGSIHGQNRRLLRLLMQHESADVLGSAPRLDKGVRNNADVHKQDVEAMEMHSKTGGGRWPVPEFGESLYPEMPPPMFKENVGADTRSTCWRGDEFKELVIDAGEWAWVDEARPEQSRHKWGCARPPNRQSNNCSLN